MTQEQNPRPAKRYARLAPLYKALIWTSFLINTVLIVVVAVLGWTLYTARNQILDLTGTTRAFAGTNIAELQDVVAKLQGSTIKYTVQLRGARLPIELEVPVQQETNVVLREPVPLSVPAAILFPGGGGNLNANVNLELPAGLQLPIRLDFLLPLKQSIPVDLDVPVNIPLRETELGPQFQRLGAVVERLVAPAEPLLTRPDEVPDSSTPLLAPSATAAPLIIEPLPTAGPAQPAP
ncbi:MAG: hypothetical protein H7Y32_07595 [Chloroflexales bacterium]|nr:hypothetical protein [Chloroflexales bacterium]